MNKDEIQHVEPSRKHGDGCGLVMNKDEIQLAHADTLLVIGCGLVMNKDEIQQPERHHRQGLVVVW